MVSVPLLNSGICRTVEAASVAFSCCFSRQRTHLLSAQCEHLMRNWTALSKYIFGTSHLALGCGWWEISISKLRWETEKWQAERWLGGKKWTAKEREWGRKDEDGEARRWKRQPRWKSCSSCFSLFSLATQFSRRVGASERRASVSIWALASKRHTEGILEGHKYMLFLPL